MFGFHWGGLNGNTRLKITPDGVRAIERNYASPVSGHKQVLMAIYSGASTPNLVAGRLNANPGKVLKIVKDLKNQDMVIVDKSKPEQDEIEHRPYAIEQEEI